MRQAPSFSSQQLATSADTVSKRSVFWLVIGLGMLVLIGGIGALTLHWVDQSDYWVDHTREVISNNQRLLLDVRDAESAERGYIITGDESYLGPYEGATNDVPPTLAKLTRLVADNPPQQERLKNLSVLISQRLDTLSQGMQRRRVSGFDAAVAVVQAGQGRIMAKKISDASQEIEREEYRLLSSRSGTRKVRVRGGFLGTMIAVALALVALLTGAFDVRRALRQRNAAQQLREESDSMSRALFQAASQAIFIVNKSGRVVLANPATERMLAYSEKELLGQPIDMLVPDAARERHVSHRDGYFNHPQSRPMGQGMDLQARRKDGTTFDAEISLSYIQSAQGILAVAFVSDISKRKADELAIRNQKEELQHLAGRLMTAQDDERRRIARDLHDDLSQKLAYLAMDLSKVIGKAATPEVQTELRTLRGRATEAANTVRHISHQLHPSILDDIGLEAAIEQYCEEFAERSGIATHFTAKGVPDSLPRQISSSVYHIFQESLRNVSKHSKADKVSVSMEANGSVLRLTVKDQGVGLPADRSKTGTSIGIVGMKERAHLVNGTFSVDSRAGEGTEICVAVPISAAE